ncbi:MAG: YceI family protein [Pseudomonadota bacterium]
MRNALLATAALAVFASPATAQSLEDAATATYSLEKNHAFLTFAVSHNGLSDYIVNFTDFDATLAFDPADPEASSLTVTIDPTALNTNYPDPEKKVEWETELATDSKFFNAGEFPAITFTSTEIARTGESTGTVTGDLSFRGTTAPVTLDVTFNGVGNMPWFGERDLIGFNAITTITRSEFGMDAMLPNIGDAVTVEFSGEFLQDE